MLNQQLILGSVYRVKFKGVFERHGVCSTPGLTCLHQGNGVFRLEAITTYRTLVHSGVKLYDTFFQPLGISREEYEQYYSDKPADKYSPVYEVQTIDDIKSQTEWARDKDGGLVPIKKTVTTSIEKFTETGESRLAKFAKDSVDFAHTPIYKFIDAVDPDDIVYAPALTIEGFPEIELSLYQDLSLVFRLGYFDDPTKLDPMLLAMRERLAAYGIRPKLIKLYSTGSKYMNPDEYEALKSVRLPAEIVTIDEDARYSDYAGRKVITTNSVKSIVDADEPDITQVSFNSLKAQPMVMDRRLFSKTIDPNDYFNGNSNYYEGIIRYRQSSDTAYVNGKVYYESDGADGFVRLYGASYYDAYIASPRLACLREDVYGLWTKGGDVAPYAACVAGEPYDSNKHYFIKNGDGTFSPATIVTVADLANGTYVIPDISDVSSLYVESDDVYSHPTDTTAHAEIQYYRLAYVEVDSGVIAEMLGNHSVVRSDHYILSNGEYVHPTPPPVATAIPGTAYYSESNGVYTLLKPGTQEQVDNHEANYVEGTTDMSSFYVVSGFNYVHPVPKCLYDSNTTYYERKFVKVAVADGYVNSSSQLVGVGLYYSQTTGESWNLVETHKAATDGVTYYSSSDENPPSGDNPQVVKIVDYIGIDENGNPVQFTGPLFEAEYAWRKIDLCPTGGKVLIMEQRAYTAEDARYGRAAYVVQDDTYVKLGYNEPRSIHLFMKERIETEREMISVDTYVRYRHPSASELADGDIVLYRKIPGKYVRIGGPKIGGIYWMSKPRLTGISNGNVIYECYASDKALQCVGYNFRYGTATSSMKTVTAMGLDDIITLAQSVEVSGIEMYVDPGEPGHEDSATVKDNLDRFRIYAGRLFRTNKEYTVDGTTQTVQVEMVVPDAPDPSWVGLTGDILGQRGIISREVYLVDENATNRNYYIQYIQQKDRADRLEDRNIKLEAVIRALYEQLNSQSSN